MSAIGRLAYQQNLIQHCFTIRCIQFSSLVFNIQPRHKFCTLSDENKIQNPLLKIEKLPKYNEITGDSISEAIPILVKDVEEKFNEFEETLKKESEVNYNWKNVVSVSEQIFDPLSLAWKAITHLHGVKNNPSLREAYQKAQPDVVALTNKISQSLPVYHAIKYIDENVVTLDEAQKRILESSLRSAEHSGVHLEGKLKEEFNAIAQELAELSTKFMNNVLDSTKSFSYLVHNETELDGLPDSLKSLMASYAGKELNSTVDVEKGPWKISLDMPCFEPFMKYSTNSPLRKMAYEAYISRASSGETNNSDIIERMRLLRKKKSGILGFNSYSDFSLTSKMAKSPSAVWSMIKELSTKAKPKALQELKTLKEFSASGGFSGELRNWDLSFWSEKQKESILSLNEEKLREYFPLQRVLDGLFSLSQELFGIKIEEEANLSIKLWNEDVKFFNIYDGKDGTHISSFFLDLYSRPGEKQGGAWMDSALGVKIASFLLDLFARPGEKRSGAWMAKGLDRDDSLNRKPIAYLVCNQSPPIGGNPSLMTFREVSTLFHEFGHGLQHMLTKVKYPSAAGINNVEWDAVELPSQFMENWLYDWKTVSKMTSHYKTGETLPVEMFMQIRKAKYYHAAMATMRQLYFAALDMELHTSDEPWRIIMDRVATEYSVMKPLETDHFPCSFLHIFAGGYAAGYYSYKWAEVLSADAFAAFEEKGLDNRADVSTLGKRFRDTFLSHGGGRHPEDVFMEFRGKKASVTSLLKSYGLV